MSADASSLPSLALRSLKRSHDMFLANYGQRPTPYEYGAIAPTSSDVSTLFHYSRAAFMLRKPNRHQLRLGSKVYSEYEMVKDMPPPTASGGGAAAAAAKHAANGAHGAASAPRALTDKSGGGVTSEARLAT
eukprot:2001105-Pleurochrysis_carterae.AAC.1